MHYVSSSKVTQTQFGAKLIRENLGFILSDDRIETHLELLRNPNIEEIQSQSLKDLKVLTKVLLLDTNNTHEAAIALLPSTSWAESHIHIHTGKSLDTKKMF